MLHFTIILAHQSLLSATVASSSASNLPADSLAYAMLLAARAVASVMAGRSLAEVPLASASELASTRASVQDLAYGALRRFGYGDAILAKLLARPLTMPEVHALLLCALYRLETRPDAAHTVVDQAVEAAGQLARGAFCGLVNGVLRNFLRQKTILLADLTGGEAEYWHPTWWQKRLRRSYPDAWRQIVAAGNELPPMTLRVNCRQLTRDDYQTHLEAAGVAAEAVGGSALRLVQPQQVDSLPGFRDGWFSVQDAGAQRAAELLDLYPGQRVLDACAAPGGKAAHILERADIELTALEIEASRARRINENLARLGLRAEIRVADCREVGLWWDGRHYDRILADVPCTASGVVRRHPDSKWLRRETDIRTFARTQRQILDALWPVLAVGGKLLYATCSVFPEENRGQVDAFVANMPDAMLIDDEQLLPQRNHDGFYYALLEKTR